MPKKDLIALSAGLLLTAVAAAEPPRTSPPPTPEPDLPRILISADELSERLGDPEVLVLDVRGSGAFEGGHVPGSGLWPDSIPRGGTPLRAETIVLYDWNAGPSRAIVDAFRRLERAGHRDVKILDSGLEGWLEADGPTETGRSESASSHGAEPPPGGTSTVTTEWLKEHFGEPGFEILDVRDGDGWRSYRLPSQFRAGHVPHSLPFSPSSLLGNRRIWPDPQEMRRELSGLGPRATETVDLGSTFILLGADATDPEVTLGYVLFRMMGLDVTVYEDGWEGWTAREETPIVRVAGAPEVRWLLGEASRTEAGVEPPEDVLAFDLRESWYYEQGHVPGALLLPASEFDAGLEPAVRRHLGDVPFERLRLILYCFGPSCTRSRACGTLAARRGVLRIIWFRGGLEEWREHGYPVAAEPDVENPAEADADTDSGGVEAVFDRYQVRRF